MIVVTGAAGFLGSAIVRELNIRGITDVHAVDFLESDTKWKNLTGLKFLDYEEKDPFLKRILFDDASLKAGVEGIIHMGACSSTTEQDASFLVENNYKYTQVMARWCVRNGKKFVYASSAATYGAGEKGFSDSHELLESFEPLNMYGYSKHLFDLWALKSGLLDKIAGIKFFNVYGPNEYHKGEMRSVVHKAYGQITETGKLKLFKSYREGVKDGGQLRDFLYVKDGVDMVLFIYEKGLKGIYNAGTGKANSFSALGAACFKAMGKEEKIEYIDMPEAIKDKYQYFTEADISKLKAAGYPGVKYTLE
ncbi:MAG TPA: ADP-glyceromanno-heptose 6-epimerase, partial [bacterium]|nr:ADP-glyceromanno-heptose 6-epimerase [bacterium]